MSTDHLSWLHDNDLYDHVQHNRVGQKGGTTVVAIVRKSDQEVVASGIARCSEQDNYSKKRGRQIALGRALKELRG